MTDLSRPRDTESAHAEGGTFGRMIGKRTAAEMTKAGFSDAQLQAVGAEGVTDIIARADALAGAGLDREIVVVWTEAAAEAFNSEMDRAAALLTLPAPPGLKQ